MAYKDFNFQYNCFSTKKRELSGLLALRHSFVLNPGSAPSYIGFNTYTLSCRKPHTINRLGDFLAFKMANNRRLL